MTAQTAKKIRRLLLNPSLAWEALKWRTWSPIQLYLEKRRVQMVERKLARIPFNEYEMIRITQLSAALQKSSEELTAYVCELQSDKEFLDIYNSRLSEVAILDATSTTHMIDTTTLYCVVRAVKPRVIVETGVHFGGTSAFFLRAIERNQCGALYSIDLSDLPPLGEPCGQGYLVPPHLREGWTLICGDSRVELPQLLQNLQSIDMFLHDSLHTNRMMTWEYETAWSYLSNNGILTSHDVLMTPAFDHFCRRHRAEIIAPAVICNVGVANKKMTQ